MISAFLVAGALVAGACGDDAAKAATLADLESYKMAADAAGPDPAAQVRLAIWCEAHGLSSERAKHLALAILYDPANALALRFRASSPSRANGAGPSRSPTSFRMTRSDKRSCVNIWRGASRRPTGPLRKASWQPGAKRMG